jgi:hypothetical protein
MTRQDDETKTIHTPPTLGRIVLYRSLGDADGRFPAEDHPAMVTGVNADGSVALTIFYRTGIFQMDGVLESVDEPTARGRWRWPLRV